MGWGGSKVCVLWALWSQVLKIFFLVYGPPNQWLCWVQTAGTPAPPPPQKGSLLVRT